MNTKNCFVLVGNGWILVGQPIEDGGVLGYSGGSLLPPEYQYPSAKMRTKNLLVGLFSLRATNTFQPILFTGVKRGKR